MSKAKLDKAMNMAGDIAHRLEGIAFLLDSFNPDGHGPRDHIAIHGVGRLLEDLSQLTYQVSTLIDESIIGVKDKEAG